MAEWTATGCRACDYHQADCDEHAAQERDERCGAHRWMDDPQQCADCRTILSYQPTDPAQATAQDALPYDATTSHATGHDGLRAQHLDGWTCRACDTADIRDLEEQDGMTWAAIVTAARAARDARPSAGIVSAVGPALQASEYAAALLAPFDRRPATATAYSYDGTVAWFRQAALSAALTIARRR